MKSRQLTFYDFEEFKPICGFFDRIASLTDLHEGKESQYIETELTSFMGKGSFSIDLL